MAEVTLAISDASAGAVGGKVVGDSPEVEWADSLIELIEWATTSDWDSAVAEGYVEHPAEILSLADNAGTDGYSFEDETYGPYTEGNAAPTTFYTDNEFSWVPTAIDGNVMAGASNTSEANFTHFYYDYGAETQLGSEVEFYYYETSDNSNCVLWFEDSAGSTVLEIGTNNPEVIANSSTMGTKTLISSPSPNYEAWRKLRLDSWDWSTNTATLTWEDVGGSSSTQTATVTLDGVPQTLRWGHNNSGAFGGSGVQYLVDLTTHPNGEGSKTESLTTASKTFGSATKPSFENLDYSLNGGSIDLKAVGSPGTDSESHIVTLDGATSYSIPWSNSHTDFRVEVTLTDGSTEPSVNRVALKG